MDVNKQVQDLVNAGLLDSSKFSPADNLIIPPKDGGATLKQNTQLPPLESNEMVEVDKDLNPVKEEGILGKIKSLLTPFGIIEKARQMEKRGVQDLVEGNLKKRAPEIARKKRAKIMEEATKKRAELSDEKVKADAEALRVSSEISQIMDDIRFFTDQKDFELVGQLEEELSLLKTRQQEIEAIAKPPVEDKQMEEAIQTEAEVDVALTENDKALIERSSIENKQKTFALKQQNKQIETQNKFDTVKQEVIDEITRDQAKVRERFLLKQAEQEKAIAEGAMSFSDGWAKKSTGQKVLAGIGILISGVGAGLLRQENAALKIIQDSINSDIDATKERLKLVDSKYAELNEIENMTLESNLRKYYTTIISDKLDQDSKFLSNEKDRAYLSQQLPLLLQEAQIKLDNARIENYAKKVAILNPQAEVDRGLVIPIINKEIPFGGETEAKEVRKLVGDLDAFVTLSKAIEDLAQNKDNKNYLERWTISKQFAAAQKALARIAVTGGGNISNEEQKLLNQIVSDIEKFGGLFKPLELLKLRTIMGSYVGSLSGKMKGVGFSEQDVNKLIQGVTKQVEQEFSFESAGDPI